MRRKIRTTLLSIFTSVILSACVTLYLFRLVLQGRDLRQISPANPLRNPSSTATTLHHLNFALREEHHNSLRHSSRVSSSVLQNSPFLDSILLPDFELLLVSPPDSSPPSDPSSNKYYCVFQNNETSPAKFAGTLPSFGNRVSFKCVIPTSVRRLQPILSPVLAKSSTGIIKPEINALEQPELLLQWSFLAFESLTTDDDVILFVKGVNNRQGFGRSPDMLRCVFFTDDEGASVGNHAVRTAVTSSSQEVFRCRHPNSAALRRLLSDNLDDHNTNTRRIKVSLELLQGRNNTNGNSKTVLVPSVAYYAPKRNIVPEDKPEEEPKSLICACTMVHNVAKFLKEWVIYHSNLGVQKFILYDNDSDDDLQRVVKDLDGGYEVRIVSWPWPKTQEAGFSHSAVYAINSCAWMMYMDVDEFVFSRSWTNSSRPSHHMIQSLLPINTSTSTSSSSSSSSQEEEEEEEKIGQILIKCLEFGPSGQKSHPVQGVTQGYTCRRRLEQRHKAIVLLSAIDGSLRNVIHHFEMREGYKRRTATLREGVVNHYKYQAWSEFKGKFRRRVSTYVVDWSRGGNLNSKDRTPGLGVEAIEPEGWANRFCEVEDERLKLVARRWFGLDDWGSDGYRMAWQDARAEMRD